MVSCNGCLLSTPSPYFFLSIWTGLQFWLKPVLHLEYVLLVQINDLNFLFSRSNIYRLVIAFPTLPSVIVILQQFALICDMPPKSIIIHQPYLCSYAQYNSVVCGYFLLYSVIIPEENSQLHLLLYPYLSFPPFLYVTLTQGDVRFEP